jgi:uncharacterized protein (UPF0548 family)
MLSARRPSAADVARFLDGQASLAGEERFTVEWRCQDDSLWYDLLAFSLPRHPLARLGRR